MLKQTPKSSLERIGLSEGKSKLSATSLETQEEIAQLYGIGDTQVGNITRDFGKTKTLVMDAFWKEGKSKLSATLQLLQPQILPLLIQGWLLAAVELVGVSVHETSWFCC